MTSSLREREASCVDQICVAVARAVILYRGNNSFSSGSCLYLSLDPFVSGSCMFTRSVCPLVMPTVQFEETLVIWSEELPFKNLTKTIGGKLCSLYFSTIWLSVVSFRSCGSNVWSLELHSEQSSHIMCQTVWDHFVGSHLIHIQLK